jgi:hypothetical protein
MKRDDLSAAKDYCDRGMEIAVEAPYPFDQGKIHSILGQIKARENGNAEKHFSKSLDIFKSLGRRYEMALVMEHLGMVKISKGQNEDGRKYVDDAKKIFKEFGVEGY